MKRLSGGGRGETSPRTSVQTYCKPCELEIIDSAARAKGWTRSRFLLEAALVYAREVVRPPYCVDGKGIPNGENLPVRLCDLGNFYSLREALGSVRILLRWEEIHCGRWHVDQDTGDGFDIAFIYPSAEEAAADHRGEPDQSHGLGFDGAPAIKRSLSS